MRTPLLPAALLLRPALSPALLSARAESPPNILYLMADDLGYSDTACFGGKHIRTPEIDRLAAQGTRFTDFYCPAPVCLPSRIGYYSGRYPLRIGVENNGNLLTEDPVTVADALGELGYDTALVGKWHRVKERWWHPMDQGFAAFFGFVDAGDAHSYTPKTFWRGRSEEPNDRYATDAFTAEALAFLNAKREKPFFLHVAYTAPHLRIEAPDDAVAAYRGTFEEPKEGPPIHATYAAMVSRMDEGIGRILAFLKEAGLEEKTVVVFTSDHGATFEKGSLGCPAYFDSNAPFRGQKRTVYEGGIRVPLIVRWPGKVAAGASSAELGHGIDLLPTFVAIAGGTVKPGWKVDGVSLADAWRGKAKTPDRDLFWHWPPTDAWAVRRGRWKLVRERGVSSLHDLPADPGERRDVGDVHPEIRKSLETSLDAWAASGPKAEEPGGKKRKR